MPKGLLVEQLLNVARVVDQYELEGHVLTVDISTSDFFCNGVVKVHVESEKVMKRFENVTREEIGGEKFPIRLSTNVDGVEIFALTKPMEEVA